MKKVLYINGNPQSETISFSRRVGKYYHEQMSKIDKNVTIEVLNVYDEEIMGLTDIQTVLVEGIAIPDKSPEEKLIDGYKIVDELFEMEAV